ncbi:CU044_5270 family protein [Actinokineospora spheciospongiae]|nr:CU044_5270 family protein [Actinokineospora spheciospongiae]
MPTPWTEAELDDALDRLNAGIRPTAGGVARARAKLVAAIAEPDRVPVARPDRAAAGRAARAATARPSRGTAARRWRASRVLTAAAAVLAVVGLAVGMLLVQSATTAGPASAAAVAALERAAVGGGQDAPVPDGSYRHVTTHSWDLREIGRTPQGPAAYLAETVIEVWIPRDPAQEWQMERSTTPRKVWVAGNENEARAAGLMIDYPLPRGGRPGPLRAACGDFYATGDRPACAAPGTWQTPDTEFLSSLPRDPRALYDRLLTDASATGHGTSQVLTLTTDVLRTGLVPADLRGALYAALTRLPGLDVVDAAANLDGKRGTALGVLDDQTRQDMIIDPVTGAFIGERRVSAGTTESGIPGGTLLGYSSVEADVVPAIGQR